MSYKLSITDGELKTTAYIYDTRNLLVETIYAGHITSAVPGSTDYDKKVFTHDGAGRKLTYLNQANELISFNYDMANRLLTRDYPDQQPDSFGYDLASRLVAATSDRYENDVTRSYDAAGRLLSESLTIRQPDSSGANQNPTTYTVGYSYNLDNTLATLTYPDGRVLTRTYTARNQIQSMSFNGTTVATNTYDDGMRKTSTTHGNGIITNRSYRNDNLYSSIDHVGVTNISYTWDANKNKTSESFTGPLATAQAGTSSYNFDNADRLTGQTRNDGFNQSYNLTLVGDMSSVTTNSVVQNRTHSNTHELTGFSGAATGTMAYDTKGNLTGNALRGQTYTWDYDNRLRTAFANSDSSLTMGSMDLKSDLILHWVFGENSQTTGATSTLDLSTNAPGDATATTKAGSFTNGAYSAPRGGSNAGLGVRVKMDGVDDMVTNDHADLINGLNGQSELTVSVWVNSSVTNQDRGIMFGTTPNGGDGVLGMRYDKNGWYSGRDNVLKISLKTTTGYTQIEGPANSQTTGWQHVAMTWKSGESLKMYINGVDVTIDRFGDQILNGTISDITKLHLGLGTKNQHWNGSLDDLRIYTRKLSDEEIKGLSERAVYRYDALGRRVTKVTNDQRTVYALSGGQVLAEYEDAATQGTPVVGATNPVASDPTRMYVYCGYIDCVCMMIDSRLAGTSNDDYYYYHSNQQYSVVTITDALGDLVENYKYTAHGDVTILNFDGTVTLSESSVGNPYTYTGRRTDAETGLLFMRSRYHDAKLQRFISRDPAGYTDGWNLYRDYFSVNNSDPTGEVTWYIRTDADWSLRSRYLGVWSDKSFAGNTMNFAKFDTKDCCKIDFQSSIDRSTDRYYQKVKGFMFGAYHNFNTQAVGHISSSACQCDKDGNGKKDSVDGIEVNVHHVYTTGGKATINLGVTAGAEIGADGSKVSAGVNVSVQIPPQTYQSKPVWTYLVCPTGCAKSRPKAKDKGMPLLGYGPADDLEHYVRKFSVIVRDKIKI